MNKKQRARALLEFAGKCPDCKQDKWIIDGPNGTGYCQLCLMIALQEEENKLEKPVDK